MGTRPRIIDEMALTLFNDGDIFPLFYFSSFVDGL